MYHLISQLASQITADFGTGTSSPVFIGVANGAFIFIADLLRKINLPVSVDFIRADSYGSGTLSNGVPKISLDLKLDIQGKHVILSREGSSIEDRLNGHQHTLQEIKDRLQKAKEAASERGNSLSTNFSRQNN